MNDSFGRNLHYLRISVTDRCNLRCGYCMPPGGVPFVPHKDILSLEEIARLGRLMARLGVNRMRLTGGEPLLRKGILGLCQELASTPGTQFLGLTTNGIFLPKMAPDLCKAGVQGINISLDTLNAQNYANLTGFNQLETVLQGLDKALSLPFLSVKINCVLHPKTAPEDFLAVLGLAKHLPVDVRLIEWMPMAGESAQNPICANTALKIISRQFGTPTPTGITKGQGPASHYTLPGFKGRLGLIPAMSHSFCAQCNRLRLTATGDLKLCLFYDAGIALKPLLRSGKTDDEICGAILAAVEEKPRRHMGQKMGRESACQTNVIAQPCAMYKIGG